MVNPFVKKVKARNCVRANIFYDDLEILAPR